MERFLAPLECEHYSAEKARLITEYMGQIFEDLRSIASGGRNCNAFDDSTTNSNSDSSSSSRTERHWSSIKQIENMIFVKNMESDVFRRVMESNQQDLKFLDDKRTYLLQAEQSIPAPPTLPRLPEEIVSTIFSILYFADEDTINELLDDDDTPENFKDLVRRVVPIVVSGISDDIKLEEHIVSMGDIVGLSPWLYSVQELIESRDLTSRSDISVLINDSTWPRTEDLQSLSNFRWKHLFIHYKGYDEGDQRKFVLDLFQKPEVQRKLRDIEYLEIPVKNDYYGSEFRPLTPQGQNLTLKPVILDVDEKCGLKLRMAILPFPILSSLRPILSRVSDLQVHLQPLMTNFNLAIDALRPLSSTLVKLVLWGPVQYYPRHALAYKALPVIERGTAVSFPRLKCLKLGCISQENSRDMLSAFECPGLEEISIEKTSHSEDAEDQYEDDSNQYVSMGFLHERLPTLKRLHLYTNSYEFGLTMLAHLAHPDAGQGGQWLLPKLDTIILDSARGPILKMLTEVVVNRLRTQAPISHIHSVTLPGFSERFEQTLQGVYLSTLNLLVPEVCIGKSR